MLKTHYTVYQNFWQGNFLNFFVGMMNVIDEDKFMEEQIELFDGIRVSTASEQDSWQHGS